MTQRTNEQLREDLSAGAPSHAAAPLPAQFLPYAPRRFRSLGVWQAGDIALKTYLIHHQLDGDDNSTLELIEAARGKLPLLAEQAAIEGGHCNLGFAILHRGQTANFVLLLWWAHGDIYCQLLFVSDLETPGQLERVVRPITACVWEAVVIAHERDAWVRTMLRLDASPADYLAALLPDGTY